MGRFDALTQLDNKSVQQSPSPIGKAVLPAETPQEGQPENPKTRFHENQNSGKPEYLLSRKPENQNSGKPEYLKNEKYSTLLQSSLIKQMKQYALEHDLKDYEVIQQALQAYLERKK